MTDSTPRGDAPQDVDLPDPDARVIGAPQAVPAGWVRLTNKHGASYYNPTTSDMVFNESGKTTIGLAYGSFNESPDEVMRLIAAAQSPPAAAPALTLDDARFLGVVANTLILADESPAAVKVRDLRDRLLGKGGAA